MATTASLNDDGSRSLSGDELEVIFRPAMDRFLQSIPEEDRCEVRSFKSIEEVDAHIKALVAENPRLASIPEGVDRFCQSIGRLSGKLEPYFSAIDSFSSAKPEILGLIWGSVQLLFKLCRNYQTFPEKLADMIRQVTEELEVKDQFALNAMNMARALNKAAFEKCTRTIADALAMLYSDILELFLTVCNLFLKKKKHRFQDILRLGKVFWVPFDDYFADFRQRFRAHKTFLEACLTNEQMNARAMAFQQLKQQNNDELDRLGLIQERLKSEKFVRLKQWLNPDPWTPALENSKRRRYPDTFAWVLEHPRYQRWMGVFQNDNQGRKAPEEKNGFFPRILAIQAKPGYGKSVLCGLIIEELLRVSGKRLQDGLPRGSVAYYFFDKQVAPQHDYTDAFRAIVTQLLHQNQDHPELMDLGFVAMDFSDSGQVTASKDDLKDLLSLLLLKIRESTLVLDGLDECNDLLGFMQDFLSATSSTRTRVIFSSRPNIDYAKYAHSRIESLFLEENANLEDIKSFLLPEIEQLVENELLMPEDTIEEITCLIAEKSRSMFLWASLLVQHLKSELMTPEDRLEAINDMSLFPELDSLYARILQKLYSLNTNKAARNLKRLCEWLCVTARPITARELRAALAIQVGSATKASRKITRFEQSVVRMTGALVEISSDETVRFIHASVLEFFTGETGEYGAPLPENNRFRIDVDAVHRFVAADCLSYLIHDGPREPLLSVIGSVVTVPKILAKYHFMLYATQFWAFHVFKALEGWTPSSNTLVSKKDPAMATLIHSLDRFLSEPATVTGWTEAAWTFGLEPSLGELPSMTFKLSMLRDLPLGRMANDFAQDLKRLNTEWRHVLATSPWEIWEPSISAFMKSPFWVQSKEATVTSLSETAATLLPPDKSSMPEPIMVSSNCSSDGLEVGLVKVWPSRETMVTNPDMSRLRSMLDELSEDWEVTYEIKTVQSQQPVFNIRLKLPSQQIRRLLQRSFASGEPKRFEFPASFSADLRQITILRYLIRVLPSQWSGSLQPNNDSCLLQDLEVLGDYDPDNCRLEEHLLEETSTEWTCPCHYDWYSITFSPMSRYLVVLRGPCPPARADYYTRMDFLVYRDDSRSASQPNFVKVANTLSRVTAKACPFAFHPTLPILAISRLSVTALWFFEEEDTRMTTVFANPMSGLSFSHCGNFIHGKKDKSHSWDDDEYVMIPIAKELQRLKPPELLKNSSAEEQSQVARNEEHAMQLFASNEGPRTLGTDVVVFSKQQSGRQMTVVRQCGNSGELVLHKATEDGSFISECVMRLPRSAGLGTSHATLLNAFENEEDARIVINKSQQETYSVEESAREDLKLPLLINRSRESIRRHVEKRGLTIEDFSQDSKRICR